MTMTHIWAVNLEPVMKAQRERKRQKVDGKGIVVCDRKEKNNNNK